MKLFGYPRRHAPADHAQPAALREATLVASPAELRKIADFILRAAREMERDGPDFEHLHLQDAQPGFKRGADLVVFNPARTP